jgi:hypothetical protein
MSAGDETLHSPPSLSTRVTVFGAAMMLSPVM